MFVFLVNKLFSNHLDLIKHVNVTMHMYLNF